MRRSKRLAVTAVSDDLINNLLTRILVLQIKSQDKGEKFEAKQLTPRIFLVNCNQALIGCRYHGW